MNSYEQNSVFMIHLSYYLQRFFSIVLAANLACGFVGAKEEEKGAELSAVEIEKLDGMRLEYDLAREEVQEKQWLEPMEKLRKGYRERMQKVQEDFAKTGDLTRALAARNAANSEPNADSIHSSIKEIAGVQMIFIKAKAKIQKRRNDSLVKLASTHIKQLNRVKARLTQARRLDSALVIEKLINSTIEVVGIEKIDHSGKIVKGPSSSKNLKNDLVVYYPFNGNSQDASGNEQHAALHGKGQFEALDGGKDTAIRFIGDRSLFYRGGGYAALPQIGDALDDGFTLSFWVKDEKIGGDPSGEEHYISFGQLDQTRVSISLNNNTEKLYLTWSMADVNGDKADISKSVEKLSIYAAKWKHFVLTYKPGMMVAFLDGAKVDESSVTIGQFPRGNAAFGRHWWNSGSSARMDFLLNEARIYSRALSADEVGKLYAEKSRD